MHTHLLTATALALLMTSGTFSQDSGTASAPEAPTETTTPTIESASTADDMSQRGGDVAAEVPEDVATSIDSGTVERSDPEMAQVIEKLMALGAKPVHTLDVPAARTQPTPADAVKAVYLENTGRQPFPEPVGKTEDIKVAGAAGELDARV